MSNDLEKYINPPINNTHLICNKGTSMLLYVKDFPTCTLSVSLDLAFIIGLDLRKHYIIVYIGPICISLLK